MQIVSVNIGRPQLVARGGRTYSTSINRHPVTGPVHVTLEGFENDRVSDRSVHGGPDKAICCYSHEHYPFWQERLRHEMPVPSFGENLTTDGMLETDICIGDTYRIGSATVQVSQPRQPCAKLAGKHEEPRMIPWVWEEGFSGFYFRVLDTGAIGAGDAVELVSRPHPDLSIVRMLRLKRDVQLSDDLRERLVNLPELAASWRDAFRGKVMGE
ncbi:MAG TPA: MOSC domain-containing protein [Phycisphaerae bacterium]|nr:MOSC domain-containing protein [Phycisphaerae bacterium]